MKARSSSSYLSIESLTETAISSLLTIHRSYLRNRNCLTVSSLEYHEKVVELTVTSNVDFKIEEIKKNTDLCKCFYEPILMAGVEYSIIATVGLASIRNFFLPLSNQVSFSSSNFS